MSPRLQAYTLLRQKLNIRATYLGVSGADHILRDDKGRVWSVDLVVNTCILNVGLPPSQWKNPPVPY
jgi:hypothetical protein